MTITINGSGTIGGISAGGYPDGSITGNDLAASLDFSTKTVTLPAGVGGGKVLQVVNTVKTDTFTTTSTSPVVVTGLTASITPSSTSNKVLVLASCYIVGQVNATRYPMFIGKNSSVISGATATGESSKVAASFGSVSNSSNGPNCCASVEFLDSPSTTSSTTYSVMTRLMDGVTSIPQVNISVNDVDSVNHARPVSSITLMEIQA